MKTILKDKTDSRFDNFSSSRFLEEVPAPGIEWEFNMTILLKFL
jgi:hypothetical protein